MDTPINNIKQLLKQHLGLDSSTIGESTIEKILHQRMFESDIQDAQEYYDLVNNNPQELSELLETAVIPETWFFRETRAFEFIHKCIQQQLIKNRSTIFNILSIPCSTGEEPYSIAMYLMDNGIPAANFKINAVDISPRNIQTAKRGAYRKNSFRGTQYHVYQDRYFTEDDDIYYINPDIKNNLNFHTLNILKENTQLNNIFDFVLCRNLLIYFDKPTKEIAFTQLSNLLKDSGYLFIGHSEFGSVPADIFQNSGHEKAFALIKQSHPDYRKKPEPKTQRNTRNNAPTEKKNTLKEVKSVFRSTEKKDVQASDITSDTGFAKLLTKASNLANTGQLDEAESLCQQYIANNKETADVLYLLGLIASSKKQSELAESLFRKSLFLEPKHYDSLIHLSLLLQETGDHKNSDLFKQRADRALEQKNN